MSEDLVTRLRKRAEIRRQIPTRKSVQEGQPDRLADLLDEAADAIEQLNTTTVKQRSGVSETEYLSAGKNGKRLRKAVADLDTHTVTLDQCRIPSCLGCGRHLGYPHQPYCSVEGQDKFEISAKIKRALDRLQK